MLRGVAAEAIWLLEHDPVITTGRRPVSGLPKQKIEVIRTVKVASHRWYTLKQEVPLVTSMHLTG